ncbi:MAG: hypothetical protein AABY61_02125 [Nitrospirota bacterium]
MTTTLSASPQEHLSAVERLSSFVYAQDETPLEPRSWERGHQKTRPTTDIRAADCRRCGATPGVRPKRRLRARADWAWPLDAWQILPVNYATARTAAPC